MPTIRDMPKETPHYAITNSGRLLLLGYGPDTSEFINQLADDTEITDQVKLVMLLSHADVVELQKDSEAYIRQHNLRISLTEQI